MPYLGKILYWEASKIQKSSSLPKQLLRRQMPISMMNSL